MLLTTVITPLLQLTFGNLGRDPEMRYTPNGQAVTSFSVAVSVAGVRGGRV